MWIPRLSLAIALGSGSAWAISPTVTSVTPTGGKLGTDVEITLNGARLDDAKELMVYGDGIQVVTLQPSKDGKQVKSLIRLSPDCALGEHQLRLRTQSGLSELRTFTVGSLSINKETEPNNELGKAQIIPINTTVTGTITSEDVDYFKVECKQGERFTAEVEAIRLGKALFDAKLAVLDPDGAPLAECDDSILFLQDPVISFLPKRSGFHYVMLRDTSWGGAPDFAYRLHLGSFPRPTGLYPAGGPAGTEQTLTFLGDPQGPIHKTVKLPSAAGEIALIAEDHGLKAPSANRFRVSPFPNVLESGDNHVLEKATRATTPPPLAFNGILAKQGEEDWFAFEAQPKQALEISVYARRLRSPLDPVLTLLDSKGKVLESNDDSAGVDSVIKFTPEAAGTYYLKIHDQLHAGGNSFFYRIELRAPENSVTLSIPEVARNDTQTRQSVSVARGNRMATLINAKRSGYNGALSFTIPSLPEGLTLKAEPMPQGVDVMPWVFEAGPQAALAGALVEPVAVPKDSTKPVVSRYRHRLELVRAGNDQVYYATTSDRLAVAVVQELPFSISLEAPAIPLVRSGSMKLRVKAERRSGFEDAINVKMLWNPPGISSETEVTIPKGKTSADYAINAKGDAGLATWKLAALASAPYKGGTVFASSDLTPVRVTEPFIVGKITAAMTEPGKPVQIRCQLDQKEPFEGKATARLVGLPDKATTQEKEITKNDKEVVFDISLDPKIPTGSHKNLSCQVQIKRGSDLIVQTVGSGGILRIVPPKKPGREAVGKVASSEAKPPAK